MFDRDLTHIKTHEMQCTLDKTAKTRRRQLSVKCNWHGVEPKGVIFGGFSLQIIIVCLPTTGIDNLFAVNLYINVILEFKFRNFVYSNR